MSPKGKMEIGGGYDGMQLFNSESVELRHLYSTRVKVNSSRTWKISDFSGGQILGFLWFCVLLFNSGECYGLHEMSPRVVFTKQGPVQGFLGPTTTGIYHLPHLSGGSNFNIRQYSGRPIVEIFKGIPYASAPVGSLRYESPAPVPLRSRTEVYNANYSRPACPRTSEEVLNRTNVPNNPFKALRRTMDSVEDCLYLDIYAPLNSDKNRGDGLAVLVYMNSHPDDPGNPWDGSSVAAIGNIIVISVRYRTGVLGFLQPSYSEDIRSNFGLWDQLAALQWIKENIGEFGGDAGNICLMGYDLDATVSGLLALSPVSQAYNGLFHRLIMINGSPFAPNAINSQPIRTTYQLARAIPCRTDERTEDLTKCLRSQPIPRLIHAAENIGSPFLTYPFSPVVDGTLVPQEVNQPSPGQNPFVKEMLGKYDILCGLKEGPVLPKVGKAFTNVDMDRFITAVIKLTMKMEPGSEPTTDVKRAIQKAIIQGYGTAPSMRELISDFLIVQPIIDLLNTHSKTGRNSYFYVFKDYDPLNLKKNDELSYIFSSNVYKWKYTATPSHIYNLSSFVMLISLVANFVRSGDPNTPKPIERYPNPLQPWPTYKEDSARYLEISEDVQFPSEYRKISTDFWGKTFLSIIKSFSNKSSSDPNYGEFPPSFPRNYNNYNLNPRPYDPDSSTDLIPPTEEPPQSIIAGGQSTVVLVGCVLLVLNFLCFLGLFYQKERLKKAEIQLRKRYVENQKQQARTPELVQDVEISSSFVSPRQVENPPVTSPHHPYPHQHHQMMRDNMSETETENGFGPDFLGPNYDPRTKVNRWMQMQNQSRILGGKSFEEYSNPTPTPSDINRQRELHRLSRVREDENLYETAPNGPTHPHQHHYHPHHPHMMMGMGPPHYQNHSHSMTPSPNIHGLNLLPQSYHNERDPHAHVPSVPQPPPPMQIQLNSLQRRQMPQPPKAVPEGPVQFIPQMPYQEPFKPSKEDTIPYADSRATSPSIISAPAGFSMENGKEGKYGWLGQPQGMMPTATPHSPKSRGSTTTPTNSIDRRNNTENNPSSILVTSEEPTKRSSTLIVRDLDPQEEESEPKYVAVKTGTLKRSVAVDTDHDSSPSAEISENQDARNGKHIRVTFKENL